MSNEETIILSDAVNSGDLKKVQIALAQGQEPNRVAFDNTLLGYALEEGMTEIALALIEAGADLFAEIEGDDEVVHCPPAPIVCAMASKQAVGAIEALIERGYIDPNKTKHLEPLIIEAAHFSNSPMIKMLVRKGANIKTTDNVGQTPFDYAINAMDYKSGLTIADIIPENEIKESIERCVERMMQHDRRDNAALACLIYHEKTGKMDLPKRMLDFVLSTDRMMRDRKYIDQLASIVERQSLSETTRKRKHHEPYAGL